MITAFNDDYGVEVLHAWGMTEMSPLGTVCTLKNKHLPMDSADKMKVRLKQGRGIFGVDMKIVNQEGAELPWDGKAYGDLLVKGPWVIATTSRARAVRRWWMAGFPPATWPPLMPMAICRSPTAART
jgi:acyl-CoA synthetase (AMP-forming)/AMP-acid ligase II